MQREIQSPDLIDRYWRKFFNANPNSAQKYSEEALDWFRKRVSKDLKVNANSIINAGTDNYKRRNGNKISIGKLYLYEYEAVSAGHDATNTYDRYPMVFFFDNYKSKDGKQILLGINVHYLTPMQRAHLYKGLLKLKNIKNLNEKTRLNLEWQSIKAVAGHKVAESAVHAYRVDRIQSRLVEIPANDWIVAVFLRTERWIKISGMDSIRQSFVRQKIKNRAKIKR